MGFGSKKMWGSLARIGLGLLPGGGTAMEAAKLGGELVIGELFLKDDEEKKMYRSWYEYGATLRDMDLPNREKKDRLLDRISTDLSMATGEAPGETDLMFNFYMVVKDVKFDFEDTPDSEDS